MRPHRACEAVSIRFVRWIFIQRSRSIEGPSGESNLNRYNSGDGRSRLRST